MYKFIVHVPLHRSSRSAVAPQPRRPRSPTRRPRGRARRVHRKDVFGRTPDASGRVALRDGNAKSPFRARLRGFVVSALRAGGLGQSFLTLWRFRRLIEASLVGSGNPVPPVAPGLRNYWGPGLRPRIACS